MVCFTARAFYDKALNALAGFQPNWEDGSENWSDESGQRWNESVDGFVHGLRAVYADAVNMGKEGEGSQQTGDRRGDSDVRMILVIERAERLKDTLPDLLVPLTRLAELVSSHI